MKGNKSEKQAAKGMPKAVMMLLVSKILSKTIRTPIATVTLVISFSENVSF